MKYLLAVLAAFFSGGSPSLPPPESQPPQQPIASELASLPLLNFDNQNYRYAIAVIDEPESIRILSNLPEPEDSLTLAGINECTIMTNGGFYNPENEPIGWLLNHQESQPSVQSDLLDGFLSFDTTTHQITFSIPTFAIQGLQSGPVLIMERSPLALKIKNDKDRRRVVAIQTTDDKLVLAMFLGEDSYISGPLLAELPMVTQALAKQQGFQIEAALNLDGGSASSFYSPEYVVTELNPIGTAICIKE